MKKLYTFVFMSLLCLHLQAQLANYREAERFMPANMWNAVFSKTVEPLFIGDSDVFWYSYKTTEGKKYFIVNPEKGRQQLLFNNEQMAQQLSVATGQTLNPDDLSIAIRFEPDGKKGRISMGGKHFDFYPATGECVEVVPETVKRAPWKSPGREAILLNWASDSSYAVFARGHDLWLMKKGETVADAVQLTQDGEEQFSYSDDDSSEEMFTAKGAWIPGTHCFYALHVDNRGLQGQWVMEHLKGRPHPENSVMSVESKYYIMAGDKKVPQTHIVLIDADTREVIPVALEKWADQKVEHLYTTKDGKSLFFKRVRRTCDELDICRVDVATGEVTVVLNEVCKPYFSDRKQSITFMNNDTEFLWWSERTGWGHYYLYSIDGALKNAVTSGAWMADGVVRLDEKRRELFVMGHGREEGIHPYYAMLYRASLDGNGEVKLLTPGDGNHHVVMCPSGKYFIDNYSRVDLAPRSELRDRNGKLVCELAEADLSRLFAMGWKMPERFTVKAADGVTDLYGTMWKPFDFDSTRQYPIISYVYPGPTHEALDLDFTVTGNHNASLAQVGFVVVNMGHRGGSPLRSRAYRTYGYGNMRDYALADDKAGLEQLARRHAFIDINRVGIFGHSAGGFMSVAALMTYPNFYKVAIAMSGNHDNHIYNQAWVETFNGIKETKDKNGNTVFKLDVATNMELAKNLKGHLLLVTGDADDNVHPAHTLRLVNALIEAGKQFDMYMLPGQHHQYKGAADTFMRRKIWFYFGKYLLGDDSCDGYIDMNAYQND